ncbi:MAG: DUF1697 domain-containing protein [Chloroflexi bacterium]|nr:DUF1697 domain-containing protein [Chloroflexota bacterium]
MFKYVALLRAINVGGRFVKMVVLKDQFEQMGLKNVSTYIQSGNVLFASPEEDKTVLEAQIESQLAEALGFTVDTMIRRDDEMRELVRKRPFFPKTIPDDATHYISFLKKEPSSELRQKLLDTSSEMDEFYIDGAHLFWLYRRHLGKSKFTNGKVEKILKLSATRRNLNTVNKLTDRVATL